MIVDCNIEVSAIDEDFLENLDELIEDYLIEIFLLNPKSAEELENAKNICRENERFIYTVPFSLLTDELQDSNCKGINILEEYGDLESLKSHIDTPIILDSLFLSQEMRDFFSTHDFKGVVLNATKNDSDLSRFYLSVSPENMEALVDEATELKNIVLQSNYPKNSYDTLHATIKKVSDIIFRPEQKIMADATQNSLRCFRLGGSGGVN